MLRKLKRFIFDPGFGFHVTIGSKCRSALQFCKTQATSLKIACIAVITEMHPRKKSEVGSDILCIRLANGVYICTGLRQRAKKDERTRQAAIWWWRRARKYDTCRVWSQKTTNRQAIFAALCPCSNSSVLIQMSEYKYLHCVLSHTYWYQTAKPQGDNNVHPRAQSTNWPSTDFADNNLEWA